MENENKDKEKRVVGKKEFVKPTVEQVKEYFSLNGYSEQAAVMAFNFYDMAGWVDSRGNKVRNWKQKMFSVWFKDEHKKPVQPKQVEYYKSPLPENFG